jgi:hypothetical protein
MLDPKASVNLLTSAQIFAILVVPMELVTGWTPTPDARDRLSGLPVVDDKEI